MNIREEVIVGVQVQGAEALASFKKTADEARGSVRGLKDVFSTADAHNNFLSKEELAKSQTHLTRIKETYTDLTRIAIENGRAISQMTERLGAMKGVERDTVEGVDRSDLADALRTARRHQRSMGGRMRSMREFLTDAEERISGSGAGGGGAAGDAEVGGGAGGFAGGLLGGVGGALLKRLAPLALGYWAYGKMGEWTDTAERFMGPGAQLGAQMFPHGMPGGGFRGVRDMFYSSYQGFSPTERMDMSMSLARSGAYSGQRGLGRIADLTDTASEAARSMGLTPQQAVGIVGTVAGATQSDPRAVQRILERIHETLKAGDFGTLKPQTLEQLAGAIAAARQHAGGGEFTGDQIQNMVKFVERFAAGGGVIGREQGVNVMTQMGQTLDSAPKGSPLWFAKLRSMGYRGGGLGEMNLAMRKWEDADTDTKIRAFTGILKEGGYTHEQIEALLRDNFGLTGKQQDTFWAAEARRGKELTRVGSMSADERSAYGADMASKLNYVKALSEARAAEAGEYISPFKLGLQEAYIDIFNMGASDREKAVPGFAIKTGPDRRGPMAARWKELQQERASVSEEIAGLEQHGSASRDEYLTKLDKLTERMELNSKAIEQFNQAVNNIRIDVQVHPDSVDASASIRSQRGGDQAPNKGGSH